MMLPSTEAMPDFNFCTVHLNICLYEAAFSHVGTMVMKTSSSAGKSRSGGGGSGILVNFS